MNNTDQQLLGQKYFHAASPTGFVGSRTLKRELARSKVPLRDEVVDDWLSGQDAYTLHKPIASKFPRRKTIVSGPQQQLQADLVDVQRHSADNDGVRFILTAIDVFSKKVWASPLKNKTGAEVAKALAPILMDSAVQALQTDKGKEFYNSDVRRILDRFGINHFSSENDNIKASIVERFNKTLKNLLHRSFTHRGRERFIDTLQNIVSAYNDRFHTAIGMAPNDVNHRNQEDIWFRAYDPVEAFKESIAPLAVDDPVRITKARTAFQRGFTPNWSKEIFYILTILTTAPRTYTLRDWSNEKIVGSFYAKELQKVKEPAEYDVEDILDRKTIRGKKMVFVKWMGYPDSFNQWIPEADVKDK